MLLKNEFCTRPFVFYLSMNNASNYILHIDYKNIINSNELVVQKPSIFSLSTMITSYTKINNITNNDIQNRYSIGILYGSWNFLAQIKMFNFDKNIIRTFQSTFDNFSLSLFYTSEVSTFDF